MFIRANDLVRAVSGPLAGVVGRVEEIAVRRDSGETVFSVMYFRESEANFSRVLFEFGQLERLRRDHEQIEAHVVHEAECAR